MGDTAPRCREHIGGGWAEVAAVGVAIDDITRIVQS